jgi:pyridoxamine 5'-phosphate oxidase
MRVDYDRATLTEADLAATPLEQFGRWFDEATAAGVPEPNAMVAATADATGAPSARTVLLKGVDARGFTFFTNLGSRKSADLAANPAISLVFPWIAMQRQVIVIGRVEQVPRDEAAAYFATRPHGSRIGAWASRQSSPVTRDELEARYADLAATWPDDVPLPEFWGGWLVRAHSVEFWQGRSSRLHDRLRYVTVEAASTAAAPLDAVAAWRVERLSP